MSRERICLRSLLQLSKSKIAGNDLHGSSERVVGIPAAAAITAMMDELVTLDRTVEDAEPLGLQRTQRALYQPLSSKGMTLVASSFQR